MDPSAEQLVNGLLDRLADDVPAGHLEPAHHADKRRVGAGGVAARVQPAPHGLDPERIVAGNVAIEGVVDRLLDHARMKRRRVDLPDPDDAVVGLELEEHEVAPAEARWGVADDVRAEPGELHRATTGGR